MRMVCVAAEKTMRLFDLFADASVRELSAAAHCRSLSGGAGATPVYHLSKAPLSSKY